MSAQLIELHQKYAGNLPRYTSYPTAVEFKNVPQDFKLESRYLAAFHQAKNVSLYVHLPFCQSLCYFCACNKIITQNESEKEHYLKLLEKEFSILGSLVSSHTKIAQIHLGGGSPSYFSPDQLEHLEHIFSPLTCAENCQKSVEIDPRTTTPQKLEVFYKSGYRRFSLGVQDFDSQVQELVNRHQPEGMVRELTAAIRSLPDTSINFDLIYGLPGQTLKSLTTTIEQVINLKPNRIALYGYAHVNWKVKVQNVFEKYGLPDGAERLRFFSTASDMLQLAGYQYIGMDHFALSNDELYLALKAKKLRRNFMGYTTVIGELMLASGVSGISDLDSFLFQNATKIEQYESLLNDGRLPVERLIERNDEDRLRAYIIEALMCNRTLSLAELEKSFANTENVREVFAQGVASLKRCESDELVITSSERIDVTETGYFFLRQISSVFDPYLGNAAERTKRFSSAV